MSFTDKSIIKQLLSSFEVLFIQNMHNGCQMEKGITSEPAIKPAAIVDQHLRQNILPCIIHQIKSDNILNINMADEVVAFCKKLTAQRFLTKGAGK